MRVGLTLSGHDPEPHSTEFCRPYMYVKMIEWMKSLPAGKYPAVEEFMKEGKFKPTDVLADQLNTAANEYNPPNDGTDRTVEKLLDLLGLGYPDELVDTSD